MTSHNDNENDNDNDKPLALEKLRPWISPKTFEWIKKDDEDKAEFQKELEAESTPFDVFGDDDSDSDEPRVQEWSSSMKNPDGIGGFQLRSDGSSQDKSKNNEDGSVTIIFILSESYDGFGDTLWASARHVANLLAIPSKCRELLSPLFKNLPESDNEHQHPLVGRRFVELGAGAGVPSSTAMRCGARVVCTDLASANRIRCMAECCERNYNKMKADGVPLHHAKEARACPCQWGQSTEEVKQALNESGTEKFEILVAADCCYMPWSHDEMLDTIDELLEENGVAIVPFALHGNTDDDDVWGIVDRAKKKGFVAEQLPTTQLTPPGSGMEDKQGLVHTLRLTKHQ